MKHLLSILLLIISIKLLATHNRAGEITYTQISNLTYEVKIITYTNTFGTDVDRDQLDVQWGDNTSSVANRILRLSLPDFFQRNEYRATHTYPGPGKYNIVVEDPNRNAGVVNIPNSVNVMFAIKTELIINPFLGNNNSPILLVPPVDKAALNQPFVHNPGAYDPDGDSLSYKLTICKGDQGNNIDGYIYPASSDKLFVNSNTGDLIWNVPTSVGTYNIAMLVEEWRNKLQIGSIVRDMQIDVIETENNPPEIDDLNDICVIAGEDVSFTVSASDIDNDQIDIIAMGELIQKNDPTVSFTNLGVNNGKYSSKFTWRTNCNHIKNVPYTFVFKASDALSNSNFPLVDLKTIKIRVIAPKPIISSAIPTSNSVNLTWNHGSCNNNSGFKIYRKEDSYNINIDSCQTGIPQGVGYELIGINNDNNDTIFFDNNNGNGLIQGTKYCYRVVSYYADSSLSIVSDEICVDLVRGIPLITNVDILNTSRINGSIYLGWSKPTEIDTNITKGPFSYLIYRSNDLWGNNFNLIDSTIGLNDTIFIDSLLNTLDNPYSYKIELYNNEIGNRFLLGTPEVASSIFLNLIENDNRISLNFDYNTPWSNNSFIVYKQKYNNFDSIGICYSNLFIDSELNNGTEYCYKIKSIGSYSISGIINPIINNSQENCAIPVDLTPPCSPILEVASFCDQAFNELSWKLPNDTCFEDVIGYKIYYSPNLNDQPYLIDIINDKYTSNYKHYPNLSLAGCYLVTAIDSFYNESINGVKVCVDSCIYYEIPNIFTPDNNSYNDKLRPFPYKFVESIDLKIYNRWGNLVFETKDPEINWNGVSIQTNLPCSDGVYYYVCEVFEYRLIGLDHRTISGFVHILGSNQKKGPE